MGLAIGFGLGFAQLTQAQTIAEGLRFQDLEQSSKALSTFRSVLAKSPTAESHFYLGNAILKYEDAAKAKAEFDAGVAKDANFGLNYVGLGSVALKAGNKAEATAQFAKALAVTKSKNAEVWYQIGRAWTAHEAKDGVEAIKALQEATKLSPKNVDYWLALGDAYYFMGEGGKAQDIYQQKAELLNPNYAKTYIKQGIILERAKNYTDALALYKKGIEKEPGYWPGYRELGELYKRANRPKEGLQYYEKYIQNSDRSAADLNLYADFLLSVGEYEKSLAVLKELDGKVKNPLIYRGFGYCQLETKDFANGLQYMTKFFAEADPKFHNARDYRTLARLQMGAGKDTAAAISNLFRAFKLDTNNFKDLSDQLKSFADNKQYKFAALVGAFMDSVNKGDAADYMNYGRSLHNVARFAEADSAFAQVNRLSPEYPTGWYWRAYNASRVDNKTELWLAQPYYEKFANMELDKEKYKPFLKPSYRYLISYYLIKQRDKENTTKYANLLLEADPSAKDAQDALKHDFSKPLPKAAPAKAAAKPAPKK